MTEHERQLRHVRDRAQSYLARLAPACSTSKTPAMVVDEVKTLSTLAALAELGIREPRASATALHQIESVCSFWRDYGFSAEMAAVISDEDLAAAELPSVVFH